MPIRPKGSGEEAEGRRHHAMALWEQGMKPGEVVRGVVADLTHVESGGSLGGKM